MVSATNVDSSLSDNLFKNLSKVDESKSPHGQLFLVGRRLTTWVKWENESSPMPTNSFIVCQKSSSKTT